MLIGNDTLLEFTASGSNRVFYRVEALGLP
jgi:hypothetical protein